MRNKIFLLASTVFLSLGICLFPNTSLRAEVKEENLKTLEATTIIDEIGAYRLPRNLWKGINRSTLLNLLAKTPVETSSPTLKRTMLSLLLHPTESRFIEDDPTPEETRNFLTLRLEQLMELGAYNQAAKLYLATKGSPHPAEISQTGIKALLFDEQNALACLEFKIHQEQETPPAGDFWENLKNYCAESFPAEKDKEKPNTHAWLQEVTKNKKAPLKYESLKEQKDQKETTEEKARFQSLLQTLRIRHQDAHPFPSQTKSDIKIHLDENNLSTDEAQVALILDHFLTPNYQKTAQRHENIIKILQNEPRQNTDLFIGILNGLAKNEKNHTKKETYEKTFPLTPPRSYVMPSSVAWQFLHEGDAQRSKGETLMLSFLTLRDTPLQKSYPALLSTVLKQLNAVGLGEIAQDLAMEAVLGTVTE